MSDKTQEKLAASLTARDVRLVPFLPYLLQDLWTLGSDPAVIVRLLKTHAPHAKRVLDLACGKGAVSVAVARELGAHVRGLDLTGQFIGCARDKAAEHGVAHLCDFAVGDVNDAAQHERGYDAVIFGAAGDILGTPEQTLQKLSATVTQGGYLLIDESYLPDGGGEIRYDNYEYLTRGQWLALFERCGLRLLEEAADDTPYNYGDDNAAIARRAGELSAKHPELRGLFEGYVRSQLDESEDLENTLASATWLLQKI